MSIFTETTEQLEQILQNDLENCDNGDWIPDADSVESFGEVAAEIARRKVTEPQLYILLKADIDACLESREDITPEKRDACYEAIRRMDSHQIFEIVDIVIDCTLQE